MQLSKAIETQRKQQAVGLNVDKSMRAMRFYPAPAGSPQLTLPLPGGFKKFVLDPTRDDNGSVGHGSRVKWVNKSEWVTWVTGQYS